MVDGRFQKVEGSDRDPPTSCSYYGLPRPEGSYSNGWACRSTSGNVQRNVNYMSSVDACSSPATWGGQSRSCGRLPKVVVRGRVDNWLMGETSCPPRYPTAFKRNPAI